MSIEDLSKYEVVKALGEADMQCLVCAAIVGHDELAREFERIDLSDEADSLADAQMLRPWIMAGIEMAREE